MSTRQYRTSGDPRLCQASEYLCNGVERKKTRSTGVGGCHYNSYPQEGNIVKRDDWMGITHLDALVGFLRELFKLDYRRWRLVPSLSLSVASFVAVLF